MSAIARRLPHIVTQRDLAAVLAQSYARALSIEEEEAVERLARAVGDDALRSGLYRGIEAALRATLGKRTTEDALMDKLAQGLQGT